MQLSLDWYDITIRLLLSAVAGAVIGLNRGEHGRPAGLRTTLIVCLAATVAMILANLLLTTTGKHLDSFVNIDPMRLPLGMLTGMGFIGGGAILRRKDTVSGITTAATLWFVTVVGLCFGAGQLALGLASASIGLLVLEGLFRTDRSIMQDRHAKLILTALAGGPTQDEIIATLAGAGLSIASFAVTYSEKAERQKYELEVRWRGRMADSKPPAILETMARHEGIEKLQWRP